MVLLDLILAHLLGDFVFQSNDLIQKKYKSWTGTFQHASIITLCTAILLFPYWGFRGTWMIIGAIFLVHFVQDCLKVEWDLRFNKKKSTVPFFVDQVLHLTLIVFLSPALEGSSPWDFPVSLMLYLIGLVLFSYTYDITVYQFVRQKSKKALEYQPNFKKMGLRVGFFTLVFAAGLLVSRNFM